MRQALVQAAALAAVIVVGPLPTPCAAPARGGGRAVREVVQIKTGDGQSLEGSFYKPGGARAPGVLLIHDAGASRAQLEPLADRLSKQGFGVLALDLRGHGASKSTKLDWAKLSESEKHEAWSIAAQDVDAAASWLSGQPSIHGTSLALAGYGAGCALVVRHAKSNENVVCMALLAPHAEDYGFDVRSDIQTLVGLPTFVATSKDAEAERMALEANASSGNPYVDLFLSPPKVATPLEDKKMPAEVVKWLADKALPKKGR
jgi:dienelactone hydrolase